MKRGPAAAGIVLTARSALTFTGFESLPSGWSSIGGTWSIVSGGVEGNALQGVDNDAGPGKASVYYWASSVSGYSSLRAIVQVKTPDGVERLGLALLADTSRLYTIDLDFTGKDKAFEIQYYDGNKWQVVANAAYKPALNVWYAIYLEWSWSGSSNVFSAVLYDASGNQLASIPATSYTGPRPAYIGLVTDGRGKRGLFDNFVVATGDPRYVVVSGLQQGWTVELRDASGNLVASATADSSGTARLFVAAKPIVANATITVKDAQGNVVAASAFNYVVGGDAYTLSSATVTVGPSGASANVTLQLGASPSGWLRVLNVTNLDSKAYYPRLVLAPSSIASGLTLNVTLSDSVSAAPIRIVSGSVVSSSTGWLLLNPGTVYVAVNGYSSQSGQSSTLNLLLEYCTLAGEQGACALYPIRLVVRS